MQIVQKIILRRFSGLLLSWPFRRICPNRHLLKHLQRFGVVRYESECVLQVLPRLELPAGTHMRSGQQPMGEGKLPFLGVAQR